MGNYSGNPHGLRVAGVILNFLFLRGGMTKCVSERKIVWGLMPPSCWIGFVGELSTVEGPEFIWGKKNGFISLPYILSFGKAIKFLFFDRMSK